MHSVFDDILGGGVFGTSPERAWGAWPFSLRVESHWHELNSTALIFPCISLHVILQSLTDGPMIFLQCRCP
ncbi:unnamed protein product [Penicillium salamii]|uniref:Uncharacterized protein n=1 Tax=Penicillium salamii TaxID=1612424 RepID=A0A9W4NG11_9EURO|nr:unnamed protein product [Penicillium salamii]